MKIARKKVNIPDRMKLTNISYRYEQNGNQVWSFNWTSGDIKKPDNMSVDIDAVTGKLRSFNHYSPIFYQGRAKLTLEKARAVAEEFIRVNNAAEYSQLMLEPPVMPYSGVPEKPVPATGFNFRFNRVVNGYPFWDNGVNITVSGVNGEIINYSFNWDRGDLPSVENVVYLKQAKALFNEKIRFQLGYLKLWSEGNISADAVLGYYYTNPRMGFDLGYAKISNERGEWQTRLVYRVNFDSGQYVDAKSGEVNSFS